MTQKKGIKKNVIKRLRDDDDALLAIRTVLNLRMRVRKLYTVACSKLYIYFLKQLSIFFAPIDWSHYSLHKSIKVK